MADFLMTKVHNPPGCLFVRIIMTIMEQNLPCLVAFI